MADSFFGFNTSLTGALEEELHDEPGHGLDEEEEEYDALNDETFGTDAVVGDWEEDHEKLAEITEQSRVHHNSYNGSNDQEDLDLEASLSQLVLDDYDDTLEERGPKQKDNSRDSRHFSGGEPASSPSYSSSAPSGYSVWGVGKQDGLALQRSAGVLPSGGRGVCTVEELERGLIQHRPPPPPGITKHVNDVERELGVPMPANFPVLGLGRGQPSYNPELNRPQNGVGPTMARHFPQPLPFVGHPQRIVPPLGVTDIRQLQAQNHRLMNSAPNLLRYLPPHLLMPPQPGSKPLMGPHPLSQGYPAENGILRPPHPHRNNMGFRPGFQGPGMDRLQSGGMFPRLPGGPHFLPGRGNFQAHGHRCHPHNNNNNNYYHHGGYRGPENGTAEYDEYAGLMTQREKQWLLNIQLLPLNTNQPYIDDYYYSVFMQRQPKNRQGRRNSEMGHRERRDSHVENAPRVYTPAQFENSLGKLQIGSVTAPRKIIDMDVVSHEGLDSVPQSTPKDLVKAKQILLEVERLYLLLLQLEDLDSPVLELREAVNEDKHELVHKIVSSLLAEDRLVSALCIRKGKTLLLRFLRHLTSEEQSDLWYRLVRCLVPVGRRDGEGLLLRFHPYIRRWLEQATASCVLQLGTSFAHPRDSSTKTLVYALSNKFGASTLVSLLQRAEILYLSMDEKQQRDWATFVSTLVDCAGMILAPNSLPGPLHPIEPALLNRHLSRCVTHLQIEKYAVLERALTTQDCLEDKENAAC